MTDAGEVVSGLFAIVVTGFILVVLFTAFNGEDISGLTSAFSGFLPGFVVALVVLFFFFRLISELG